MQRKREGLDPPRNPIFPSQLYIRTIQRQGVQKRPQFNHERNRGQPNGR
jgi:hypothetical protein